MNDNKPTTREKASSQVPATIDRSRLITEFQLANTTEAISGYRQMLESMLEVYGRASNKRQMLKDEMFQNRVVIYYSILYYIYIYICAGLQPLLLFTLVDCVVDLVDH